MLWQTLGRNSAKSLDDWLVRDKARATLVYVKYKRQTLSKSLNSGDCPFKVSDSQFKALSVAQCSKDVKSSC